MTRTVLLRQWEPLRLLDGSKTMIARPAPTPASSTPGVYLDRYNHSREWGFWLPDGRMTEPRTWRCPIGEPGTVLLCKEAWAPLKRGAFARPGEATYALFKDGAQKWKTGEYYGHAREYAAGAFDGIVWRPAQHMPRWAPRLRPVVVSVTAKRCTEITEEECDRLALRAPNVIEWGAESPRPSAKTQWAIDNPRHPWESSWAWLATVRMDH